MRSCNWAKKVFKFSSNFYNILVSYTSLEKKLTIAVEVIPQFKNLKSYSQGFKF